MRPWLIRCFVLLAGLAFTSSLTIAEEAKQLEGTWKIVSALRNGKESEEVKKHRIVFGRDTFRILLGEQVVYEGTYSVDESKKPATIDFVHTGGADKGKTWLGIFQLEKGMLTICDNALNLAKPRPTSLESRPDSGVVMVVCKREKP